MPADMASRSSNAAPARKRSASIAANAPIVIPEKLYFRIGEVAGLCRLPASVLRFWETEFPHLKPTKSDTGQRMYRRQDVEQIVRIKDLLYTRGFTIAGARQALREENHRERGQQGLPFSGDPSRLKAIRRGLEEVLAIVSRKR